LRLPYAQVAMEILEVSAAEMSIELGMSEAEAGWAMVRLIPWALARCPDHEPPSESDVVVGPNAAKLIARAVGYQGDAEAFVDAGERLRYPIFERLACGVRIRGLDRYDAAWGSNHRPLWEEWQSFRAGTGPRPGSPRVHSVNTKGKRGPDADADADASSKTLAGDKHPPVVRIQKPPDPRLVALTKQLERDYEAIRHEPYVSGGVKDSKGLKKILPKASDIEIRRRWVKGIEASGWASCSTLAQLGSKWNDLAAPSGDFDPNQGIISREASL
jgi:hypothetical protein